MNVSVTMGGAEQARAELKRIARYSPIAVQQGLAKVGLQALRLLRQKMTGTSSFDGFWGKTGGAGASLGVRSGITRARISSSGVVRSGDTSFVAVGSPDRYVKNLNDGGDFTSSGKMFRRPTAAAQTGAGVDRYAGTSIRDIPGVFLKRLASGSLWAVLADKRKLTFLYLLTRSIHFRHRGFFEAAREELNAVAGPIVGEEIAAVIRG